MKFGHVSNPPSLISMAQLGMHVVRPTDLGLSR